MLFIDATSVPNPKNVFHSHPPKPINHYDFTTYKNTPHQAIAVHRWFLRVTHFLRQRNPCPTRAALAPYAPNPGWARIPVSTARFMPSSLAIRSDLPQQFTSRFKQTIQPRAQISARPTCTTFAFSTMASRLIKTSSHRHQQIHQLMEI